MGGIQGAEDEAVPDKSQGVIGPFEEGRAGGDGLVEVHHAAKVGARGDGAVFDGGVVVDEAIGFDITVRANGGSGADDGAGPNPAGGGEDGGGVDAGFEAEPDARGDLAGTDLMGGEEGQEGAAGVVPGGETGKDGDLGGLREGVQGVGGVRGESGVFGGGFSEGAFGGLGVDFEGEAPGGALEDVSADVGGAVAGEDPDVGDATADEAVEGVFNERLAEEGSQGEGEVAGEGIKAGSLVRADEEDSFHVMCLLSPAARPARF